MITDLYLKYYTKRQLEESINTDEQKLDDEFIKSMICGENSYFDGMSLVQFSSTNKDNRTNLFRCQTVKISFINPNYYSHFTQFITKFTELIKLDLSNTIIDNLIFLIMLRKIQILIFSGCKLLFNLNGIQNVTTLKKLLLNDTPIQTFPPLLELMNLEYLDLSRTPIQDFRLLFNQNGQYHGRKLKTLILSNTPLQDFSVLSRLINLEYLDLSDNNITEEQLMNLNLPNLRVLLLNNCRSIVKFRFLTRKNFPKIQHLDLSNTRLSTLEYVGYLTSLKKLFIANTLVSNLLFIRFLTELEMLDISSTTILSFENLSFLQKLVYINLSNTKIRYLRYIVDKLKILVVNNCENLINIEEITRFTQLEKLEIEQTLYIPDEIFFDEYNSTKETFLKFLKSFKKLNFFKSTLDIAIKEYIKKEIPQLQIK